MEKTWYVLRRGDEFRIEYCEPDLYGYGSWSLFLGPFASWDEAEHSLDMRGIVEP